MVFFALPIRLALATYKDAPVNPTAHTITASVGTGGSISPSGTVMVNNGGSQTFTISANSNYSIASVTVDGVNQGALSSYGFNNVIGNHTVSASFNYNGGGSSGGSDNGGSSSGDNGSIITPPATSKNPTPPTTVKTEETEVTEVTGKTDKDGKSTATVPDKDITNAIDKAQKKAKKNGTEKNGIALVMDVKTDKNATSLETTLSQAAMDAQIKAGVTSLTIQNELGTVTFDLAALKALAGGEVKLSISKVDPKTLSAEAQSAIGNRPAFRYDVTVGGKAVTDFKGGSVGLQMPYTRSTTEQADNLCGVYVDANGKVIWLENSRYDTQTGMLLASASDLSVFGVGYKQSIPTITDSTSSSSSPASSESAITSTSSSALKTGANGFIIVIALLIILGAATIIFLIIRKRRHQR